MGKIGRSKRMEEKTGSSCRLSKPSPQTTCPTNRGIFSHSLTGLPHRARNSQLISLTVISYLKLSGSNGSTRPSAVSACGYMK